MRGKAEPSLFIFPVMSCGDRFVSARWRHPVGIFTMIVGLFVYVLVAMWIGAVLLPDHDLIRLGYYACAGLAWIVPAAAVIKWMARDPSR
jgi:uncharacterized membrane protein YiaA